MNQRVHVAGTWDGQQVMLYLNGKPGKIPSVPTSSWNWPTVAKCFIGRNSTEVLGFDGLVHSVRVSSNVRYQAAFSPQRRWESDEQTLAIYHFDEGSGVTLKDSSGHNRHGTITNAEWLDVSPHSKQSTPGTKNNLAAQDGVIRPERDAKVLAENDPERDVAEWVLQNGGQIKLLNQGNLIEKVADLPTTPLTVTIVWIRNVPEFTVADAQRLTKLREVDHVEFISTTLAPGSIKALAGCRHLQGLGVQHSSTTDSTLSEVLLIPQLRRIGFIGAVVTDDIVARLSELSQLTNVGINGCQRVTEAGLIRMAAAPPPKMHSFTLAMPKIGVPSLRAISGLPHLQWLALAGQKLGENSLIELARAPALSKVTLDFESGVNQAATAELQKRLPGCQIWVSKPEFASPLNGPAYRDTIRQLMAHRFNVLVSTNVGGGVTWISGNDPFPAGDVVFAEHVSTKYGDAFVKVKEHADLKHIAQLSDLRALTLGNLPPDGLRDLLPLKNLYLLIISGPLTDADIALLPSFPKLSELTATIPNDAALETIAKLPHLSLLLPQSGSGITDNGLKALESATTLSQVDLTHTNISREAAQAFADARPDVIVIHLGQRLDPIDPDRAAAEWIINHGGDVALVGHGALFAKVAELPREPFMVRWATIRNVPNFTVADAQRLARLRELETVNFYETTLSDGAIRTLAGCRHLQILLVSGGSTTDAILSEALLIPQLRGIRFINVAVSDDFVARLGQISQLLDIQFYGCQRVTEAGLVRMAAAPPAKLQWLKLGQTKVGVAGLKAIAGLPHLQRIELQTTSASLVELASCQSLVWAEFAFDGDVSQEVISELQKTLAGCQIKVSRPEQASLLYGPAYRDTIRKLMDRGFKVLVSTNVGWGGNWIGNDDPFPNGDVVFAERVSTKDDEALAKVIEHADLHLIAKLSDLPALTLGNLPPDGLRELLPLKNLRDLWIRGPLTDADIALLPSFPKLSELNLAIPNDAVLEAVAKLPHLTGLNFGTTSAITGNGLKALESARLLSTVDLGYMNISQESAQALADARPDIIVIRWGVRLDPK